jgi:hypothetical protein
MQKRKLGRRNLEKSAVHYEQRTTSTAKAYSAGSANSPLAATTIPRREPTDQDVQIDILFCGICHSDLHYARDEWHDVMPTVYPCVPAPVPTVEPGSSSSAPIRY